MACDELEERKRGLSGTVDIKLNVTGSCLSLYTCVYVCVSVCLRVCVCISGSVSVSLISFPFFMTLPLFLSLPLHNSISPICLCLRCWLVTLTISARVCRYVSKCRPRRFCGARRLRNYSFSAWSDEWEDALRPSCCRCAA